MLHLFFYDIILMGLFKERGGRGGITITTYVFSKLEHTTSYVVSRCIYTSSNMFTITFGSSIKAI